MAMLKEKFHAMTRKVKDVPSYFQGKPFARIVLDGHFTPDSGARMARMFPVHLQLELRMRGAGSLVAEGTLDVESHLSEVRVIGEIHPAPWCTKPFMTLGATQPEEGSFELEIPRMGKEFLVSQRLEGRITGFLGGDLGLVLPSEQFMALLRLG